MAHRLITGRLKKRQSVVDATAGNGHDALFLAEQVGEAGTVYAFDVQQEALDATKERLTEAGFAKAIRPILASHEKMAEHIADKHHGKLAVVMFNLGYLPGGDKQLTTHWEQSVAAMRAGLQLLRPGGLMTIVCYPGHPAGAEEANAVQRWVGLLDQVDFRVVRYGFENVANDPPFLLAIEKN